LLEPVAIEQMRFNQPYFSGSRLEVRRGAEIVRLRVGDEAKPMLRAIRERNRNLYAFARRMSEIFP